MYIYLYKKSKPCIKIGFDFLNKIKFKMTILLVYSLWSFFYIFISLSFSINKMYIYPLHMSVEDPFFPQWSSKYTFSWVNTILSLSLKVYIFDKLLKSCTCNGKIPPIIYCKNYYYFLLQISSKIVRNMLLLTMSEVNRIRT